MEEVQETLSPEELQKKRDDMKKFYEESMPYLITQLEYEKTLMEIDEVRFKRSQIQMQHAYMALSPEEQDEIEREMQEEKVTPPAPAPEKKKQEKKKLRTS